MSVNDSLDRIIAEVLKEDRANTPEPPRSKQEIWERLQDQLADERDAVSRSYRTAYRSSKLFKLGAAALLVLVISMSSLYFVNDGSALGWFSKYMIHVKGTVTNIFFSNSDEFDQSPPGKAKPPIISESETEEYPKTVHMSLEEVRNTTNFPVLVPQKVPDGYSLEPVEVTYYLENLSNEVKLLYTKGSERIVIDEFRITGTFGTTIGFDSEDAETKEVFVKGEKGALLLLKNGTNILLWNKRDIRIKITSNLTETEMMELAESM